MNSCKRFIKQQWYQPTTPTGDDVGNLGIRNFVKTQSARDQTERYGRADQYITALHPTAVESETPSTSVVNTKSRANGRGESKEKKLRPDQKPAKAKQAMIRLLGRKRISRTST